MKPHPRLLLAPLYLVYYHTSIYNNYPIPGFFVRLYSEYQDMVRICLEHGGITGYRDNEKKKDTAFQLSRGTIVTYRNLT